MVICKKPYPHGTYVSTMSCFTYLSTALLLSLSNSFTLHTPIAHFRYHGTSLFSEPSNGSRLQGNQRLPSPSEIETIDEMIDRLANAPAYELPSAVTRSMRVVGSPRFFLRIAELADEAKDVATKNKLSALAENIARTVEVVVSTTENKLDKSSEDVEAVIKAAADEESGEFFIPLSFEQVEKMKNTLQEIDSFRLDEGFLTTIDAYMDKSQKDGLDGMVTILQKILQLYAGKMILNGRSENLGARVGAAVSGVDPKDLEEENTTNSPSADLLEKILESDVEMWDGMLVGSIGRQGGDVTTGQLLGEVQRTMEAVVLGLENGSMAQRVQAEFMRELLMRIENIEG